MWFTSKPKAITQACSGLLASLLSSWPSPFPIITNVDLEAEHSRPQRFRGSVCEDCEVPGLNQVTFCACETSWSAPQPMGLTLSVSKSSPVAFPPTQPESVRIATTRLRRWRGWSSSLSKHSMMSDSLSRSRDLKVCDSQ